MIDNRYVLLATAVMAAVTFALRALPFVAARALRRFPVIDRLGRFLPPAIMTLLLLHTLTGNAATHPLSGPWNELAAAAAAMLLQLWLRQPLVSILGSTVLYVLLSNRLLPW